MRILSLPALLALSGCLTSYDEGYQTAVSEYETDAAAMQATIDTLSARLDALEGGSGGDYASASDLTALTTRVSTLETDLGVVEAAYATEADLTALETLVANDYATVAYVDSVAAGTVDLSTYVLTTTLEANHPTFTDLAAYALDSDLTAVSGQLSNYALTSDLSAYAQSSDLDAYALLTDIDTVNADIAALDAATPGFVGADMTIDVDAAGGGDFADIPSALASLDGSFIAADAVVTIAVADGTYVHDAAIEMDHPMGRNIYIVGNTADPAAVVLQFTGSDGFRATRAAVFGEINGFTLEGPGVASGVGSGLVAYGGFISCGTTTGGCSVVATAFGKSGAVAESGGVVVADRIEAVGNVHGLWLRPGGNIRAWWADLSSNTNNGAVAEGGLIDAYQSTASSNGNGYSVGMAGFISAPGSSANGNTNYGYLASRGSIRADLATATGNANGFSSRFGGSLDATGANAESNVGFGLHAGEAALMTAANATASGNGTDFDEVNTLGVDGAYIYAP